MVGIPLIAGHSAFSAMRARALSQSKTFAGFILIICLVPVGANVVRGAVTSREVPHT